MRSIRFFDQFSTPGLAQKLIVFDKSEMNLGAQKVKTWRMAQRPKVTRAAFVTRFGLSVASWSVIESGERMPPLKQAVVLQRAGICTASDWLAPPSEIIDFLPSDEEPDSSSENKNGDSA